MQINVDVPLNYVEKGFPSKTNTKGKKETSSYVSIKVQLKKPQQPNWERKEIVTFINAKWDEHIIGLNKVGPRNQFEL